MNMIQNSNHIQMVVVLAPAQPRKQRELWEREQRLLDIAHELIAQDGLLALQMSQLARAAEYAIGTIYSHFSSKEDLLLALAVRSGTLRLEQIRKAVDWNGPTRLRMMAVAMADWQFMNRHPEYARIEQYAISEVVWARASEQRRNEFVRSREPIGAGIFEIVEDARANGELPQDGFVTEELPFGMWTMLIGTHQLAHAQGLLEHFAIHDPYTLMVRHMTLWLNGLGWQPLMSPHDAQAQDGLCQRLRTEVFPEELP